MDFEKLGAAWAGVDARKPNYQEKVRDESRRVLDSDFDEPPEDRRSRLEALMCDWD
tara:strand:- start:536 stop:703 length:168 start_codon:yes stop_codon:yes gene_type:complete